MKIYTISLRYGISITAVANSFFVINSTPTPFCKDLQDGSVRLINSELLMPRSLVFRIFYNE